MRVLILFLICLFTTFLTYAQNSVSKRWNNIHFQSYEQVKKDVFFNHFAHKMRLTDDYSFKEIQSNNGSDNLKHTKYQLYYNDIKVFGSQYILHEKNGYITHSNGIYSIIKTVNLNLEISNEEAISKAKNHIIRKFDLDIKESFIIDKVEKVIINSNFPSSGGAYQLVFQVDIFNKTKDIGERYFFNSKSHVPIISLPLIAHQTVPAKGYSKTLGEVTFLVDSVSEDTYRLIDTTRGTGIITSINNKNAIATDEDNYWEEWSEHSTNVAVEAHYGASRFYDMLGDLYGWKGLDNVKLGFESLVYKENKNGDFLNAFWNGSYATFGNGNCHTGPLTTLEIVGHEFMHGVTDHSSNLVYQGESGAINESMSDVFGKMLEYHYDPNNFNWQIGKSILEDDYTLPFRSIIDPNSLNDPYTYKGNYWFDNGGVHTNSSVGNHFFYRLVEGGSGTTESGKAFNFEGIGMDKASEIIFICNQNYLTEISNYNDYYNASLNVCENLYGNNSVEYHALENAWLVVGIPENIVTTQKNDLSLTVLNPSFNSCVINDFVPITIYIENTGENTYDAATIIPIKLSLSQNQYNIEVQLVEALAPGEIFEYVIDDVIIFSEETSYYINITLEIEDANITNNSDYYYANNYIVIFNNLRAQWKALQFIPCKGNEIRVQLEMKNESCQPFESGLPFNVKLLRTDTEQIFFEKDVILEGFISEYGGSRVILSEEVDFTGIDEAYAIITHPDYATSDNDETVKQNIPINKNINNIYETHFNTDENFSAFHYTGLQELPFIQYNGKYNLWTTGGYSNNDEKNLCTDPLLNYEENGNYSISKYSTCLNLYEFENPYMEFNLAQFRKASSEIPAAVAESSASLKIEYIVDEEIILSDMIYGQNIGEYYTHFYNLPKNTEGELRLSFYNHTGHTSGLEFNPEFDNQLMSYFTIGELVYTDTDYLSSKISLFPNPTNDFIHILTDEKINNFKIYDTSGRLILQSELRNRKVNISEYQAGVYFIHVYNNNQLVGIDKLVITE